MNFTSLKEITEAIISIIQAEVDPVNTVKVLPELLRNDTVGVGFYLFHVQENNHFKNYPAPSADNPPVKYTPMALNLYYQLSANWKQGDTDDAYEQQRLMSIAMKALHDNPIIKLTPAGKEINVKINLQNITPSESVQYWAASESPVRLSAYYEVSVVFLEPEKPKSYASRVLSYGNWIFVNGTPQISGSENILDYTLPGELTSRQIKIQPAQAPVGSSIRFSGTGFNSGSLKILLHSSLWIKPAETDNTWLLKLVSQNQIEITIQSSAKLQGSLSIVDIVPGLYSARIQVTELKTLPNGTTKEFNHLSNQFPFSVAPRIDNIVSGPAGFFSITGQLFQHAGISQDDVEVFVGETKLTKVNATPLGSSEFIIQNSTTIELQVPLEVHGPTIPIRVMVRGIESGPNWINIP